MKVAAKLKQVHVSPQKARLVADQVRGLTVSQASKLLDFSVKKSARLFKKLLSSAVANAESNFGADIDELRISEVFVDAGPVMKRTMPRAKGRANRILKRTSHIVLTVSDSY